MNYAHEDYVLVRRLAADLRRSGRDVWLDKDNLRGGQKWFPAIKRAIRESGFFIAVLSRASTKKRGTVQREVRLAIEVLESLPEDEVFIVPARTEECEPSFEILNDIHWVDLFPDWRAGVQDLLRATEPDLGRPDLEVPERSFARFHTASELPPVPRKQRLALRKLVVSVLSDFEPYARRRNVELRLESLDPTVSVVSDRRAVTLALSNVIHNALKYSYSSATQAAWVTIRTENSPGAVRISIENLGVGILEEELEEGDIFKAGYRGRRSLVEEAVGTGIGLYVASRAIDLVGGTIEISSSPVRRAVGHLEKSAPYITRVEIVLPTD